ncbi:amidohydrolase family protein [Streptomyces malaysiensis]|uniref:amidohydrolase family protein n=1 Tax=Streptomyces malaysiensis TaxID=92644 RepID=UPI00321F6676|nr:amidohydrolase family protein [Streptomyces malaysiensis]
MTTLISGGHILSMDPAIGELPRGDVLVEDGTIAAVAGHGTVDAPGAEVIDASGTIVVPGFVDGHRHVWQSLLRGIAADWSLSDYMLQARALYAGCYDEDSAYLGNLLGGLESLSAGITTVVDHCHLQSGPRISDALARGLLDSGVGGVFCYALQNVPVYDGGVDPGEIEDVLTRMPDAWHDTNAARIRDTFFADDRGRLRFGVALPEATPYLPGSLVRQLLARADTLSPFLVTGHWVDSGPHGVLAELCAEGAWPDRTCLSHGNHIEADDLARLAEAGVSLCTTPDIECGMGIGPLAARRFRAAGGAAAIGTDLSNYARADVLQQARLLLQVERFTLAQGSPRPPRSVGYGVRDALALATLDGAEALGLADTIGSLSVGKRADVVLVRPDPLGAQPYTDPAAAVLFTTSPAEIDTVLVAGEVVKRDGVVCRGDLGELQQRIAAAAAGVRARHHQLPRPEIEQVWAGLFS